MKKAKSILDNRIVLLLISFLCAMAFWFYRATLDEVYTKEFRDIPVTINFEDSIPQRSGLTISHLEEVRVTLELSGARSTLGAMNKDDITVSVDWETKDQPGTYSFELVFSYDIGNRTPPTLASTPSATHISVSLDRLVSKQVEVKVATHGTVAEGYMIGDIITSPMSVEVSGPEGQLDKVENVQVKVDVQGLTSRKELTSEAAFVDADGAQVYATYFTGGHGSINVVIPVLQIKEIPLTITPVNKSGGSDATLLEYAIEPQTLRVAVQDYDMLNQISLGVIDTSTVRGSETFTFDITTPSGVKVLDEIEQVVVTVDILGGVTRRFSVSNIEISGVPDGTTARVSAQSISVQVRALSADMTLLSAADITAHVDLSGVTTTAGTVSAPVVFTFTDGKTAGVVGKYSVNVTLS